MKKVACFIFLSFILISAFADINEKLLEEVRKANSFDGEKIGYGGEEAELYKSAEELVNSCTNLEILNLIKDESPVVRCYTAYFIQDKDVEADWYSILLAEIEDYDKLFFQSYDILWSSYAGDFIIQNLFDKLNETEQNSIKLQLVQRQSKLSLAQSVLQDEIKSDELYKAARNWALAGNPNAIFSLAKYKKTEDLQLIKTLKDKSDSLYFRACLYNLDDSYKPELRDYMISIMPEKHYSSEWKWFYKLVAAFHDNFSKEIFDMAFSDKVNKDIQKYHLGYIYDAMKDFNDGFYDSYLKTLWVQHDKIDNGVIDYFLRTDKDFALDAMKKTLINSEEYFMNTETLDYVIKVLNKNNVDLTEYFERAILKDSVTTFRIYMDNIRSVQIEKDAIIKAMESRLKTEWNTYVCVPLYNYLISLNDKSIDDFLVKTYKKNKKKYPKWSQPEIEQILNPIMKKK